MEAKDGTAKVKNPRTDGFVSLQATVADAAGSRVRQIILRAYGSGRPDPSHRGVPNVRKRPAPWADPAHCPGQPPAAQPAKV